MTTIIALEKDLFFSVKIRDTLSHHGIETIVARNLNIFAQKINVQADSEARPALAIINIAIQGVDWEEAIRKAHALHYPILAFGAHMDLDARKKALEAGANKVVANSKFVNDMPGLIQRLLTAQTEQTNEDASDEDEGENETI